MEITTKIEGTELTVYPVGKIDSLTTPILEKTVAEHLDTVESVVIDMEKTVLMPALSSRSSQNADDKAGNEAAQRQRRYS